MSTILTRLLGLSCMLLFSSCSDSVSSRAKITILGENSATIQAMMSEEKTYESAHPNIDLDFKPNTFDDAFKKSNQDFANGTGIYDIILQYNFTLSSSVRNRYVYLIEELTKDVPPETKAFERDIFPELWKEIGYYYKDAKDSSKGLVKVGYPSAGLSMLLMYNKTMFEDLDNQQNYQKAYGEKLAIPTNWDEYYKVAQFFTNSKKGTYGVCIEGATGGFLYYEYVNFLYGMGGRVMDKQRGWHGDARTRVVLNSPESVKALKFYKSLKPFNAGSFADVEQYEQMAIMKKGKTAMAIVWSDMVFPAIKKQGGFDTRFGFTTVPGAKSILGGGAYFINRRTKHPRESAAYILDLMQPATQVKLAKQGLCSPLNSVYNDPGVKRIPYANALKASLERGGIGLEAGPDANMVSEVITTYIQMVWAGKLSEEEALATAQREIETKRNEIFAKLK